MRMPGRSRERLRVGESSSSGGAASLAVGVFLVLAACSGGGDPVDSSGSAASSVARTDVAQSSDSEPDFETAADEPAVDESAKGYVAPLDASSSYAESLCELDFDQIYASDEPLVGLLESLREARTDYTYEADELARIIETIESIQVIDGSFIDDAATMASLADLGALLGARCE